MLEKIEQDLKAALLAGDKIKAETLKSIKNALDYAAMNLGVRDQGLDEEQKLKVLAREAKKRQEAADIYQKAGEKERAQKELSEKNFLEAYLPERIDEDTIKSLVGEEISKLDSPGLPEMGKIIGAVRTKLGPAAEGSTIARLVKEALEAQ